MTEREWVSIYTTETDGDLNIDPTEVDSAEPFTPSELRALLSSRLLTPDARIILRLYLGQKQVPVRASRNRTR
jgi:hypothetical protein